jgi:hypothetical protein
MLYVLLSLLSFPGRLPRCFLVAQVSWSLFLWGEPNALSVFSGSTPTPFVDGYHFVFAFSAQPDYKTPLFSRASLAFLSGNIV